ncbi:MAG: hypothetical protein JSV48_06340 [Bradyrhizobium sp.]|nr:MAG: hypothetical protein JSV48_06340 [Bradyrhizobium sp.]
MTALLDRNIIAPVATKDRIGPDATPRIKLTRRGIAIRHPDPQAGERLLAEALGAADADALHGILRQLVKASAVGQKPNEANLAYMISMTKSIAPKDSIEAMLVSQMVCVHMAAMRSACRLACTDDLPQQEGITRALAKLARTFAAQMEALNRHRSTGACAITVQNLSVQDGGKAVVGNFTQHANFIGAQQGLADTVAITA